MQDIQELLCYGSSKAEGIYVQKIAEEAVTIGDIYAILRIYT